MFTRLLNNFRHSRDGYDRQGNATLLLNRPPDPEALEVPGVSCAIRDEALELLCKSFEIPRHQMFSLRRDDELMSIYRSFNGERTWDRFEFELLWLALDELPGQKLTADEQRNILTVEDLIRIVASRRG